MSKRLTKQNNFVSLLTEVVKRYLPESQILVSHHRGSGLTLMVSDPIFENLQKLGHRQSQVIWGILLRHFSAKEIEHKFLTVFTVTPDEWYMYGSC